jgi:8-oxo-dGTP pyrophosphatase MutT (NUDIX family)
MVMDDVYIKSNIFCNNCGKSGHLFHQCKLPITSIGIIALRKSATGNGVETLLIRRKNSLGFVDFMRGKYNINNIDYIINLFNKMSSEEHQLILTHDFAYLWRYLWGTNINNQYRNEERVSQEKLTSLKNGVTYKNCINQPIIDISGIIAATKESYLEPEWGFPKGRRNYQERDIACAIREFEEETGYTKHDINIVYNLFPIEEIYTGSNYKSYKHKYYLALMNNSDDPKNPFQETEISQVKWVQLEDAIGYIRGYNIEKRDVIDRVIRITSNYSICM